MEPVPVLLEKLAGLSDSDLERSAQRFARREKRNSAAVIAHIAEISRRDLHLRLGYRNLFEYVEDRLGFRGGAAGIRIHVGKKAKDCPRLVEALWKEEICLSGAALLVPHLNAQNAEDLIGAAAGRSIREIEAMLRRISPLPVFEPEIRKAPQPRREVVREDPRVAPPEGEVAAPVVETRTREAPPAPARTSNVLQVATPETYNFRFSADKAFRDKLERLAEVLGASDPVRQMGEILERAVDCLLERKDPERRRARRLAREERKRSHLAPDVNVKKSTEAAAVPPADSAEPARSPEVPQTAADREPPRRPGAAVWGEALERAGHQCEFRGEDGRRCTSRTGLQPDHYPVPWSVSKSNDLEGIRVHCPAHNALTAREYFGKGYIEAKIAEAKAKREASRLVDLDEELRREA